MAEGKRTLILGELKGAAMEFVLIVGMFGLGAGIIAVFDIPIKDNDLRMIVGGAVGLTLLIFALFIVKLFRGRDAATQDDSK